MDSVRNTSDLMGNTEVLRRRTVGEAEETVMGTTRSKR